MSAQSRVMQVHSKGEVVYEVSAEQVDSVTFKLDDGSISYKDLAGAWVSNPEPNVTITLTIALDRVNVRISPSGVNGGSCPYMIHDGEEYLLLSSDKMYLAKCPNQPDHVIDEGTSGFNITKLTPDSMELNYFGFIIAINCLKTNFLFDRKID